MGTTRTAIRRVKVYIFLISKCLSILSQIHWSLVFHINHRAITYRILENHDPLFVLGVAVGYRRKGDIANRWYGRKIYVRAEHYEFPVFNPPAYLSSTTHPSPNYPVLDCFSVWSQHLWLLAQLKNSFAAQGINRTALAIQVVDHLFLSVLPLGEE